MRLAQALHTNEKLHATCAWGVFGHGESGMGHGEEATNALCPVPKRRGDYPSPRHLRDGVERRFQ
ncbi:hypothetical protein [Scytonema sp. PCC 10023]|uniref:hypothetical protein n=1 Tax=Scytonema sp. PCC 10023 TaxID=1680591 RepID=UPI0039C748A8